MTQCYRPQMETIEVTITRSMVIIDCYPATEESRPLIHVIAWMSLKKHHHIEQKKCVSLLLLL